MGIMTKKDQEHLRRGAWYLDTSVPQHLREPKPDPSWRKRLEGGKP